MLYATIAYWGRHGVGDVLKVMLPLHFLFQRQGHHGSCLADSQRFSAHWLPARLLSSSSSWFIIAPCECDREGLSSSWFIIAPCECDREGLGDSFLYQDKVCAWKFISLLQCLCNFSHTFVVIAFLILYGCKLVVRFWCELDGKLLSWILWCQQVLNILKCNLNSFGEHSFSFLTPSVWNLLPAGPWNFPILSLLWVWVQNSAQEFPV